MMNRRERVRQATIDEIKAIAWEIVKESGPDEVTVNGIAKKMGMTPPAFYSYYKSRDELIKSLIIEAYKSYQDALIAARDGKPESDIAGRIYSVFMAYWNWAIENPNFFGLFAGRTVPGFNPPEDEILREAETVYEIFNDLYKAAWRSGQLRMPASGYDIPESYRVLLEKVNQRQEVDAPVEFINIVLNTACLVHGAISMTLSGRFNQIIDSPFLFYQNQILDLLNKLGLEFDPSEY